MSDHEDDPVFGDVYEEPHTRAITSSVDKGRLDQSEPATAAKLGDLVRGAHFSKKGPEEVATDSYYISALEAYKPPEPMPGNVNDSVACPYGCGTVLTGVNAFGNLTRHLKGTGCAASGRKRPAYMCQVDGCGRKYSRSDGLRVHMRRRHGASMPLAKTGLSMGEPPVAQGDWVLIREMAPTQPDIPEQLSQHALEPSHRDVDPEKEVKRWSMPEFGELGRELEGMWPSSRNSGDHQLQDEIIAEDSSGPHALPMPIESVPVSIAPHISDTWTSNTSPVTRPPSPPPGRKMALSLTFEEAQFAGSPSDSAGDNNKASQNGSGHSRRSRRPRNESMSSPFPLTGHEAQSRALDSKPDLYEGFNIPKRERYRVSYGRANSASLSINDGNWTMAEINQVAALLEPTDATFGMPEEAPNDMNRRNPEVWSENVQNHDMHFDDESSKGHKLEPFPIYQETANDHVLSSPLPHEVDSSKQEAQIMPAADQGMPGRYLKSSTLPVAEMYPLSSSDSQPESEASPPVFVEPPDTRPPHTLSEEKITQSSLWSSQEEETLLKMRAAGREWEDISMNVLSRHSPMACSKRHEWLMESRFNKSAKHIEPSQIDSIRQLCAGRRTPDLAIVHHEAQLGSPTVYLCPNEGCAIPGKGFARKRPWRRHVKRCKASIVAHAAHETDWGATTPNDHRTYAASNSSSSFSYADSVLSTASLASSATDLSKNSIYSADQIARATKELITILQEDPNLALLYEYAIESASIGPERLERNLHRLFRGYADLLDKAAGDTIELHAARLVKMRARVVARSIVQKYDSDKTPQRTVTNMKMKQEQDQSSEEENDTNQVDERIFEDLVHFRDFLVRGEAFTTLRAQIQSFILPKPIREGISENKKGKGKLRDEHWDAGTLGGFAPPPGFEALENIDFWSSRAIVEALISDTPREMRLRGRSRSLRVTCDAREIIGHNNDAEANTEATAMNGPKEPGIESSCQNSLSYIKPRSRSLTEHHLSTRSSAPSSPLLDGSKQKVRNDRITKELHLFFLENKALLSLYRYATANCLGALELHRDFCHIFQEYAWNLDISASNELESLASHLVRRNARDWVDHIIERCHTEQMVIQSQEGYSDEEVDGCVSIGNDSLDPGDIQHFLQHGDAFTTFCAHLRSLHQRTEYPGAPGEIADDSKRAAKVAFKHQGDNLSTPNILRPRTTTKRMFELSRCFTTAARSIFHTTRALTSKAMITMGCLEPPLRPGFTRLRWQCRCGTLIHDDVRELRAGGLAKLIERLQHATGTTVAVTTYNQGSSSQKYTFQYPSIVRKVAQKVAAAFGESKDHSPRLPQHMPTPIALATIPTTPGSSPNQNLHMMACMRFGRHGHQVYQDPMHEIKTDKALLSFIRTQLARRRGHLRNLLSWNCVQEIYFVKFRLRLGGSAELRVDGSSCASRSQLGCECIPLSSNTEYDCSPAGPPDTCPPVTSQYLMHMLTSPECKIDENQTWVLNQLPKRRGQLDVKVNKYADGWGLHFKEDLDGRILSGMVFIVLAASFLFSVLWSAVEKDIQGGFGVGSYVVAAVAVPAALALNRSGKLG